MMKFEVLNIKNLTEEDFFSAFECMSDERKVRCLRYKFKEDRKRMAFGDMLLKKLITDEYKVAKEDIELINLPSGKPVAKIKGKEFFVSISHSGDFVSAAVCDADIGIDIEVKREVKEEFLKRVLKEDELMFLNESENRELAFLKIWTAKEAYLKLNGEGLSALYKAEVLPIIKGGSLGYECVVSEPYVLTVIYKI